MASKKKHTAPVDPASTPETRPAPKKKTAPKKSAAQTPAPTPATTPAARAPRTPVAKPKTTRAPKPPRRQPAAVPTAAPAEAPEPAPIQEPESGRAPRGLRILMATAEAHPFAKTGGLAEVAAALPAALTRLGHSVTVVLPRYRDAVPGAVATRRAAIALGPRRFDVGFIEQTMPDGVRMVLVDVPALFDRPGLYGADGRDYPDNALRFAVLSRAALEFARLEGERLDVIHAHDWQTGLVPVYQKMLFSDDPVVGGVPAVFTIHNLAFQGVFGRDLLQALGLGWELFTPDALEYWGNISLLKGGVNFSESITTVSPTYAREILTPELGFGFDGALRRRAADLTGILNGIDTARWDPATDPFTPHYSAADLAGKREAKRALLEVSGLPVDDAALARPLIGLISRLTDQKGFDLIGASLDALMSLDATWVMLGSGERHYEDQWQGLAAAHPDRVATTIGFDERLAHAIEAGADMFLMPSRFEPCGLNQLYSLRYGTVPIVRATGGLRDTVLDAGQPGGNGIVFEGFSPGELVGAVRRALALFRDSAAWQGLQRAGMAVDPSWDVSAREYVKVYERLVDGAGPERR
jgi:starch synthase